ncbi:FtsK/SpoIIIE domain-containing protein, partial [Listeria monocytogenes]
HWYEAEETQSEGFFKDLSSKKTKQRIRHFPKMYYRMKDGLIHIHVEITLGKYQDQLLHLENKLETGLYCELVEKTLKDSYVEYVLLYDTIGNRIGIEDVVAQDGRVKLMESVYWEFDSLPHMLIAGGTGSGKSYFILTLIESLLHTNAKLYILDPKNADLADLGAVIDNVYYRKDDMLACISQFYDDMIARSETMKQHPNYKTGENYAYLGLPANFLIFDEYVAMMDMLGRDSAQVMNKLKQIVMLGRQAGFFLILACQRPDAKYFSDGIRDNFNFRVALGRMSEMGFGMMFGSDTQKQFFLKPIKGRGYVDTGKSVISEFYTPLVPKRYDFLGEIGKVIQKKQSEPVPHEVKGTGSDLL